MARTTKKRSLDTRRGKPWLERFIEQVGIDRIIEHVGLKRIIQVFGEKEVVKHIGVKGLLASLSPAERQEWKRRLHEPATQTTPRRQKQKPLSPRRTPVR